MATNKGFGLDGFLVRFVFAIIVVFATYNPEGVSYYHWVSEALPDFTVIQAFVGVIILIGWGHLNPCNLRFTWFYRYLACCSFLWPCHLAHC